MKGRHALLEKRDTFEYDIALSFAGEQRPIVKNIADELQKHDVSVFYDEFEKSKLWGKSLSKHFRQVYGAKTRYVVTFISKEYPLKNWTDFEFSIARDEANNRENEFILPVKIDDTKVFGLPSDVAYLDLSEVGINGIVESILDKLPKDANDTKVFGLPSDVAYLDLSEVGINGIAESILAKLPKDANDSKNDEQSVASKFFVDENRKNVLIKNGKELPYLESKSTPGPANCTIYAQTYNRFGEKTYFLETSITHITLEDLKRIINCYYSIFSSHRTSAFGINQETCSWFGFGPLNFISALEMQDIRYSSLRENNAYIHHREAACFIDELNDVTFYIHSQPNRKNESSELITLDYVNIGFLFNDPPFNNIYHKFFETIKSIPESLRETDQSETVLKTMGHEFEAEGFIINNLYEVIDGWICGIHGKNTNELNVTEAYNDKIIVDLRDYHEIGDKCKYEVLSVETTTLPAGNFPATIVNYKGNWELV